MNKDKLMCKVFGFSSPTYFRWKKENRVIIKLLEKYFTDEELKEFLESGRISSKEEDLKQDIKSYIDEQIDKRLKERNI